MKMEEGTAITSSESREYRLINRIGRGGVGEVWLAEEKIEMDWIEAGREVAIKILRPELLSRDLGKNILRREIKALEELATTPYFISGDPIKVEAEEGEYPAIVMQYAGKGDIGKIVDKHISRGFLVPVDLGALWLQRTSKALAMLHEKEITHRDIKPQNILISDNGNPMFVDVGLAVIRGEEIDGLEGKIYGSPGFYPPEYLKNPEQGRKGTKEEDIYTLGLVGYYLLTGTNPLKNFLNTTGPTKIKKGGGEKSRGEIYPRKISKEGFPDIVPPSEYCEDVPVFLSEIIMNMLSYSSQSRLTATEISAQLSSYLYDPSLFEIIGSGVGPQDSDSREYLSFFNQDNYSSENIINLCQGIGKFYFSEIRKELEKGRLSEEKVRRIKNFKASGIALKRCLRTFEKSYGIECSREPRQDFFNYIKENPSWR